MGILNIVTYIPLIGAVLILANCTTPTQRRKWWLAKLNGNAARDQVHQAALRKLGWRVIVIWECEVDKSETLSVVFTRVTRRVPQH